MSYIWVGKWWGRWYCGVDGIVQLLPESKLSWLTKKRPHLEWEMQLLPKLNQ